MLEERVGGVIRAKDMPMVRCRLHWQTCSKIKGTILPEIGIEDGTARAAMKGMRAGVERKPVDGVDA